MPETTNFNIPFLDGTELVRDYPTFSEDLANAVDAGLGSAGKILQVVRATDSTSRSTNSGSFVDVTGMSVTITPTSSSNNIIIIASFAAQSNDGFIGFQITDSSDTAISGQEGSLLGELSSRTQFFGLSLIAYDSPATTSAETYKLRFRQAAGGTTATVRNNAVTGQMFAIEVAA